MVGKVVQCECGELFREISQLKNVRQLGLALKGECPSCGSRVAVNSLWKLTKIITYGKVEGAGTLQKDS